MSDTEVITRAFQEWLDNEVQSSDFVSQDELLELHKAEAFTAGWDAGARSMMSPVEKAYVDAGKADHA